MTTQTSSPSSHKNLYINAFIAAVSASAVVLFLLLTYYAVLFRRRCADQIAAGDVAGAGEELRSSAEDSVADRNVWRSCSIGLNDFAINSIPMKPYVAGRCGGVECAVCLGEFCDGENVRFIPVCDHAFHVLCIDTWLREHDRCPVCRGVVKVSEFVEE